MKDKTELIGVYDTDSERLHKTAEELRVKEYTDWKELLQDKEVEAVIVTSYHTTHARLVTEALNAGKHVLCEKPVATNLKDALMIKEAADKTNKIFMALPNDAYTHIREVKKMIGQGQEHVIFVYSLGRAIDEFKINLKNKKEQRTDIEDDELNFLDRKSTRLNSSHSRASRMPSSA